jgi:hypothetical protein
VTAKLYTQDYKMKAGVEGLSIKIVQQHLDTYMSLLELSPSFGCVVGAA